MDCFTRPDPIAEDHYDVSPYAYCLNNPTNYIDPLGLDTVKPQNLPEVNVVAKSLFKVYNLVLSSLASLGKQVNSNLGNRNSTFSNNVSMGIFTQGMILMPLSHLKVENETETNLNSSIDDENINSKEIKTPNGWIEKASKKSGGKVLQDPANPRNSIRVMPGNPKSPNLSQQLPYVKYQKSGIFYDVNGMSLPNGSLPSAHIPLNQFDITKMPNFN